MNFAKFTLFLLATIICVVAEHSADCQTAIGGCETVTVSNIPSGPQTWGSWTVPIPCDESPSDDCCTILSNPFEVFARFQLMEKQDDGSFLLLPEQLYQRDGQFTFDDLDHGTYKVQVAVPNPVPCTKGYIKAYNLQTGQYIGYYGYYSHATFYETNEVVVGPTNSSDISYTFIDVPETGSESTYDFDEDVIMDVSQCRNYDKWYLAIFEDGPTYSRYHSNGWTNSTIPNGQIDLTQFWQTRGWQFEELHSYTVQFVIENQACRNGVEFPNPDGWNNLDRTFFVCPFGSGCRIGQKNQPQVSISPNPTSSQFSFNNFDFTNTGQYQLVIYDMTGRIVKYQKIESSDNIDVADVERGMYIVKLLENDNEIYSGKLIRN